MSIRYKFLLILGLSQIILLIALSISFTYLLREVKNIPQNQRAADLSQNFQRELDFKDEKLKILLQEILANPSAKAIFQNGFSDRSQFSRNLYFFKSIMDRYHLSIFEVGDREGKVLFRAHRPTDWGDSKKNQPIIEKALKGQVTSTLEDGKSGLGFRLAAPLLGGTILIGQVVDDAFTKTISKDENTHLAIFMQGKPKTIGSETLKNALVKGNIPLSSNSRFTFETNPYFLVRIPFKGDSTLKDLEFVVMISENEVESKTNKIWSFFTIASLFLFGLILLISFLFARDMVDAIKVLTFAMNNIDTFQPKNLPVSRKDEIGQMGRVFLEMKEELDIHQNNLELLVKQRTKQLNETLDEIKKLKEQQDGDYFLTSLLIRPLQGVISKSENISTYLLEKQKKEFEFRNKTYSIGGDVIIVDSIELLNVKYSVFVNADAMGKSIQGAGGALVFGTVFRSILNRTKKMSYIQDKHPERWLKDCFQEIHNVFISFDGHMLISAIFGLIDDQRGTLYSLNSEHPQIVLFRDNKASFIGNDRIMRKIGFTELDSQEIENDIEIDVIALKPGDKLVLGSDGRDDLLMSVSDLGVREINHDEGLFLHTVEKSQAKISEIYQTLTDCGELTDDLSLLVIGYKEERDDFEDDLQKNDDFIKHINDGLSHYKIGDIENSIISMELALASEPEDAYCLKELSKLYLKSGKFDLAIKISQNYLSLHPEDTEYLFYVAYGYKKLRSYKEAADFAERLRLREPKNIKNLLLLSEIYIHLNNKKKVETMFAMIDQLDPGNSKLLKLSGFYKKKVNDLSYVG